MTKDRRTGAATPGAGVAANTQILHGITVQSASPPARLRRLELMQESLCKTYGFPIPFHYALNIPAGIEYIFVRTKGQKDTTVLELSSSCGNSTF
jgi:hypothetical protein